MGKRIGRVLLALGFFATPIIIIIVIGSRLDLSSHITKHINNTVSEGIGIARTVEAELNQRETNVSYIEENRDVRWTDVSSIDLSDYLKKPPYLDFDTTTKWPGELPESFQPDMLMELGKNPGLGVRSLHEQGINGAGVSIAIIDQVLYTQHQEYKDNLMHYEEIGILSTRASMHGAAVASLAVGKETGVAPGSKLYYIASELFESVTAASGDKDYQYYAKAINRLLDLNEQLPERDKIRVISISKGFASSFEKNTNKLRKAIKRAMKQKVFVVTTSMDEYYDYTIGGLGKTDVYGDPDNLDTYTIGSWEEPSYFVDSLLVPMDGRTYAGTTGEKDYEWRYSEGLSWTCPYVAGLYALAAQVKPDITPEEFLKAACQTADKKDINSGGLYTLNYIVNPTRLIHSLQE